MTAELPRPAGSTLGSLACMIPDSETGGLRHGMYSTRQSSGMHPATYNSRLASTGKDLDCTADDAGVIKIGGQEVCNLHTPDGLCTKPACLEVTNSDVGWLSIDKRWTGGPLVDVIVGEPANNAL